jgi:hypothetical protein
MLSKIYYVQRHDFDDWADETGRVQFQSAHATLALANAEAKELLHYILEEDEDYHEVAEIGQDEIQSDGFYRGTITRADDELGEKGEHYFDLCVVTVEETVLNGGIVQVIGEEQARKRLRTHSEESEDEAESSNGDVSREAESLTQKPQSNP